MDNLPRTPEEYREWWTEQRPNIPYGCCWCGCGETTNVAPRNDASKFMRFRGEPLRYIIGHGMRDKGPEYVVDQDTGCWIWQHQQHVKCTGAVYGRHGNGGDRRLAHVVYWERENGPVPPGKELHHICVERGYGTTLCCRPTHVTPVSHTENVRRGQSALLSVEQVREIKVQLASGVTQKKLAEAYGVAREAISAIATGRNWQNVTHV